MNREEYMKRLKKKLHPLPKADFEKAVEYFEEYFADAGAENESQAMEDLGAPESAAEQIIRDLAIRNTQEPVKDVKKGLNAVWVGILAICAAPIALPVLMSGVLCIVLMVFSVLMLLFSGVMVGAAMVLCAPVCIIGGFLSIGESLPVFLNCFGMGLLCGGLGLMITYGMVIACRVFLNWVVKVSGRIVKKGGKRNEQ